VEGVTVLSALFAKFDSSVLAPDQVDMEAEESRNEGGHDQSQDVGGDHVVGN